MKGLESNGFYSSRVLCERDIRRGCVCRAQLPSEPVYENLNILVTKHLIVRDATLLIRLNGKDERDLLEGPTVLCTLQRSGRSLWHGRPPRPWSVDPQRQEACWYRTEDVATGTPAAAPLLLNR
jgi:hypothetical protein